MNRVLVHGHRGARARFPENTLPAFRHAIEAGADFLELDTCVTKDDCVVVCHDPVLTRRTCSGPARNALVRELTLDRLREWDCGSAKQRRFRNQAVVPGTAIPTLAEVLALGRGSNIQFNIEVKSFPRRPEYNPDPAQYADLLVEAISRSGFEDRVILQSFDFRILHEVRRRRPSMRLAALYQFGFRDFPSVAQEASTRIVAPHYSLVTREKVLAAHQNGIEVVTWTANRPGTWKRLVRAGVDGIITDDPEALIAFLRVSEVESSDGARRRSVKRDRTEQL